ncbi:MAG TPA: 3-phosphoserine/phosphohydroxythreonine transaminase [bacterium]|nr:3-phosphoserine/phosphohydroxythreonine transaminase [bacterium]
MNRRVFNFTAGPSMMPLPVLKRAQEEWLDFEGLGASVIEISHLAPEFKQVVYEVEALLRELLAIPANYRIAMAHGGGAMEFSMVPLNLIATRPARKALYVNSGYFSGRAADEASKYGTVLEVASSEGTTFDHIPALDPARIEADASYLHITTNNTMVGTRWHTFPDTDGVPLVGDATSEILSRPMDISRFGVLYAGAQKNMGTSGLSVAIVREDLLGQALPITPKMINYGQLARDHSLSNTANTFAIYMARLVLEWIKTSGGLAAIEAMNEEKAKLVYDALDRHPGFYKPHAHPEHRSRMNVTFRTPSDDLDAAFVAEGNAEGLYALKGHRFFGGMRASIYNGMPVEGARALANFIDEFARRKG